MKYEPTLPAFRLHARCDLQRTLRSRMIQTLALTKKYGFEGDPDDNNDASAQPIKRVRWASASDVRDILLPAYETWTHTAQKEQVQHDTTVKWFIKNDTLPNPPDWGIHEQWTWADFELDKITDYQFLSYIYQFEVRVYSVLYMQRRAYPYSRRYGTGSLTGKPPLLAVAVHPRRRRISS
jgi:hypothetical protein